MVGKLDSMSGPANQVLGEFDGVAEFLVSSVPLS